MYKNYLKRCMDIMLGIFAIIILSPVLLLITILVFYYMGQPIIFTQDRVGKNEVIFKMYKFRTMRNNFDKNGEALPDEERLTSFGRLLRSTSLDELPELFNIIKGDMSFVGPRPLLVEYLPYYTNFERQRHLVRGGLTQPEVLYGKVIPTWNEQFAYEVDYVKNISFLLDLKIMLETVSILFKRNAINYGGYVRKSLIEERTNLKYN